MAWDDDLIEEALASGRHPEHREEDVVPTRCAQCHHARHEVRCLTVRAVSGIECGCPGAAFPAPAEGRSWWHP